MKNKKIIFISLCVLVFGLVSVSLAATNIVSSPFSARFAWNDMIGWIDFYNDGTNGANVRSLDLQGYASSSVGAISLDCHTSPAGNICSAGNGNYQVLNNGAGDLSGWAWNDSIGWISFCGTTGTPSDDCPLTSSAYHPQINLTTGDFSGWAWSDVAGWISFHCADFSACVTYDYKVQTTWTATSTTGYLDSSTFDTGISGGAQINSVVWQGSMPSPTNNSSVTFQFAVSNDPGGPWDYKGPDGSANTYYPLTGVSSPNVSIPVDYVLHSNMRYFRYRITLASTDTQTFSPRVDSVSVNWSR